MKTHKIALNKRCELLSIPRSTVGAWLRRLGMGRLQDLEPKEKPVRYEKSRPGELVHLDTKKLGRIGRIGHRIHGDYRRRARGVGWEFLHVCVDDATRVSYNEVLADEKAVTITGFLERAVAWFAARGVTVERVMTDNGTGYISHRFAETMARLEIRHIRTRPYRPQTNGKAERFIQTAIREWAYVRPYRTSGHRTAALSHFQKHYNGQRDHSSIGDQPPLSRLKELL